MGKYPTKSCRRFRSTGFSLFVLRTQRKLSYYAMWQFVETFLFLFFSKYFSKYFKNSAHKFPKLFFISLKAKIFRKNSSKILFSVILENSTHFFYIFYSRTYLQKFFHDVIHAVCKIQCKVLSTQDFVCDVTWEIRSFFSQVRILFSQSSRKWIQTLFSRRIGLDSVSFIAQNFRIHLEA